MELPTIDKFVLVVLADYADDEHSCFPGQGLVAKRTGSSVSTVARAMKRLEEAGLVRRDRRFRKDGSRTSDRYFLPVP